MPWVNILELCQPFLGEPGLKVIIIGGTVLIGRKLTAKVQSIGYDVVAAAPPTEVNSSQAKALKELVTAVDAIGRARA